MLLSGFIGMHSEKIGRRSMWKSICLLEQAILTRKPKTWFPKAFHLQWYAFPVSMDDKMRNSISVGI
jgi:hypothetical protein